jgi:YD repeat-containing protein
VYIADTQRNPVRRVAPDGIITTVAGTGQSAFGGDGAQATQAGLNSPTGMAFGPDAALYIADTLNSRVRRVGLDGVITTVAGAVPGTNGDGVPATTARLSAPRGLAFAPDGTLVIADTGHERVRSVATDGIIRALACNGTADFGGDGGASTRAQCKQVYDVAVTPDRRTLLADSLNHRVRQVALPLPGLQATDILIAAPSGDELYVFDATGRHLRTLDALTAASRWQFSYDPSGRLTSIADAVGNITTIERCPPAPPYPAGCDAGTGGSPLAIVAPGGQRTTFALDDEGFLETIANPASEAWQFTYTSAGLLRFQTDPMLHTYAFDYDAFGRLRRDDDPADGFKTLDRATVTQGFVVTLTTALNRVTTYLVERLIAGSRRRVTTLPKGVSTELATEVVTDPDGTRTVTHPDGGVITTVQKPDPRFGMQTPALRRVEVTREGLVHTVEESRQAPTLEIATDPLSVLSATSEWNLNGRLFQRGYTRNGTVRTLVDQTPAGRTRTLGLDPLGRVIAEQVSGLAPTSFAYDPLGRLERITHGSGPTAREYVLAYDPRHRLQSITDPLGRVVTLDPYDDADRVRGLNLPGARTVSFGYDARGDVRSITPPGRPAHAFTYTPVRREETYTPPEVGQGSTTTTNSYNVDRQLEAIVRPGSPLPAIDYGYHATSGRLQTITTAAGTTMFTYHPTSGRSRL